ncbi:hypothetical protein C8J56DRAFT_357569 [Mycena floridula]|nr:hypothetical protein C8J56DRAFT_357569 [Mycena floridula]
MPTTRSQTKQGEKRTRDDNVQDHPKKKARRSSGVKFAQQPDAASPWMPGTIERGHIYFFYRPKVQLEEVNSLDDVRNFQMILVPRPPESVSCMKETDEITAAPADEPKKRYRLIVVGKKRLPDPARVHGRKESAWATVTRVGDDLDELEKGLGEKTYETKTRGIRHEEPVRLVARGGYAIVNNNPRIPSQRETHLGYRISHPKESSDVQESLGIYPASSFVLQIKNPLTPSTGPTGKGGAEYPEHIMNSVFGKGTRGRQSFGLKFASCDTTELLDYEGCQMLLIAARKGDDGLEASLGDGRGNELSKKEKKESFGDMTEVFKELGLDCETFPAACLEGQWI